MSKDIFVVCQNLLAEANARQPKIDLSKRKYMVVSERIGNSEITVCENNCCYRGWKVNDRIYGLIHRIRVANALPGADLPSLKVTVSLRLMQNLWSVFTQLNFCSVFNSRSIVIG